MDTSTESEEEMCITTDISYIFDLLNKCLDKDEKNHLETLLKENDDFDNDGIIASKIREIVKKKFEDSKFGMKVWHVPHTAVGVAILISFKNHSKFDEAIEKIGLTREELELHENFHFGTVKCCIEHINGFFA